MTTTKVRRRENGLFAPVCMVVLSIAIPSGPLRADYSKRTHYPSGNLATNIVDAYRIGPSHIDVTENLERAD